MKKIWLSLLLLNIITVYAQLSSGINASLGDKKNATHLWIKQEWGINKQKSIKIGAGLRFSHYNSYKGLYLTAPISLTKVDYTPSNPNIDTLRINESRHFFTNLNLVMGYTFKEKFDFRFSIDLIGLSFGGQVDAEHINNYQSNLSPKHTQVTAKPTTLNLLLVSDNDIGSLNSEFTIGYWVRENIVIFGGYSFLFSEYTTDKVIRNDNKRFRQKAHLATFGIGYKIK